MSRLTEAESEMDGRLGAGIPGHVQIHRVERGQVLAVLQKELADAAAGPVQESPARKTIQTSLQVSWNPRRVVRIGPHHVGGSGRPGGPSMRMGAHEQISVRRRRIQQTTEGLGVAAVSDQPAESSG